MRGHRASARLRRFAGLLCFGSLTWLGITARLVSAEEPAPENAPATPWNQDWTWEGAPDCEDPHAEYDPDCWACEGSPPVPVPRFSWTSAVEQCPELKVLPVTNRSCVCLKYEPGATASMTAYRPGYQMTKPGKRKWMTDPPECGEEREEEFGFAEIGWSWSVEGVTARPESGGGEIAEFEYDIPEEPFTLVVNFTATGKPDEEQCDESSDTGAGAVVDGQVYRAVEFQSAWCDGPRYEPCGGDSHGETFVGDPPSCNLSCVRVCSAPCEEKWQLQGRFDAEIVVNVYTSLLITRPGCTTGPPFECVARDPAFIALTEQHEMVHCEDMRAVLDEFNLRIAQMGLHDSEEACRSAGAALIREFVVEWRRVRRESKDHQTPGFRGLPRLDADDCGNEYVEGAY